MHVHLFVEFNKAVDWTTLDLVRFTSSRPDVRPTIARGENQEDVITHNLDHCFDDKIGTLRVETSGWEPWQDYPVKGLWIDDLWTAHKLSHQTDLEYTARKVKRKGLTAIGEEVHRVSALVSHGSLHPEINERTVRIVSNEALWRPRE